MSNLGLVQVVPGLGQAGCEVDVSVLDKVDEEVGRARKHQQKMAQIRHPMHPDRKVYRLGVVVLKNLHQNLLSFSLRRRHVRQGRIEIL